MWKLGLIGISGFAAGYLGRDYYNRASLPFNLITKSNIVNTDAFLVYVPQGKEFLIEKIKETNFPTFYLPKNYDFSELGLPFTDTSSPLYLVRKIGSRLVYNSLELPEKFSK